MFEGLKAYRSQAYVSLPGEEKEEFMQRVKEHAKHNFGEIDHIDNVVEEFNGQYRTYVVYREEI